MPTAAAEHFLEDYDGNILPWARPAGAPVALETDRILFGNGDNALEVVIASATRPGQPRAEDLRALFKKRQANRPTPVLLAVTYVGTGDQPLAADRTNEWLIFRYGNRFRRCAECAKHFVGTLARQGVHAALRYRPGSLTMWKIMTSRAPRNVAIGYTAG